MVAINLQFFLVSIALATTFAFAAPSATQAQGQTYQAPSIIPDVWKSLGDALGSDPLTYTMSLKGRDMDGLTQKMYEISESQGEWLTKDELKQYASVSDEGRTAIINYLKSQGLNDSDFTFSALGDEVEIRSSVAQASQMLRATFETFIYSGEAKAPRTKEYTVDASIAEFIENIYPIANFQEIQVPKLQIETPDADDVQDEANAPAGCNPKLVTPQCLRNLYGTSKYKPSKGKPDEVDIGITQYLGQYTSQRDLTQFLKKYRPEASGYVVPIENLLGAINSPGNGMAGEEAMLDVEIVVAATFPLQATVYNVGSDMTDGDLLSLTFQQFIKANSRPKVTTTSYGYVESTFTRAQAFDNCRNAQKLAALGTTIVFSSGDSGVGSPFGENYCPPFERSLPSGCQFITSVGATEGFAPERVVKKTNNFWSGAGVSNYFSTPQFQKAALTGYLASPANVAPKKYYNATGRGYPDVSTYGSHYVAVVNGQKELVGGTSASAPTFASIIALVNDARRKKGKGSVGWINPRLYKNPQAFTDVTLGASLGCGDKKNGFYATESFDLASGLGTPKFSALRKIFGA